MCICISDNSKLYWRGLKYGVVHQCHFCYRAGITSAQWSCSQILRTKLSETLSITGYIALCGACENVQCQRISLASEGSMLPDRWRLLLFLVTKGYFCRATPTCRGMQVVFALIAGVCVIIAIHYSTSPRAFLKYIHRILRLASVPRGLF